MGEVHLQRHGLRRIGAAMKIAVTSQNFRTITGHAGKTRRFLVYEDSEQGPQEVARLDLPKELAFHEFHGSGPHPVDGVDVLITAGCGEGFVRRLAGRGIRVVATGESDPLAAVRLVIAGQPLPPPAPDDHHHGVTIDGSSDR
jgi:predicted Fe-Mo cluster-binding NifX family protein